MDASAMDADFFTRFIESVLNSGLSTSAELRGISDDDVHAIEDRLSCRFPEAYRQFLLFFGRSEGKFPQLTLPPLVWQCQKGVIDAFVRLRSSAERMLDSDPCQLPRDAVVISTGCEDYQVYWIASEGPGDDPDDPPVFYYMPRCFGDDGPPRRVAERFTAFLDEALNLAWKLTTESTA